MRQSKLTDEQIVALLREAEKGEKSIAQLARENQVTPASRLDQPSPNRFRTSLASSPAPTVLPHWSIKISKMLEWGME